MSHKPFYVTTPIFYPNARPHIGHLQSLVTADIIARFQRILNPARPVVFLTGTDEHGLKMQQAATCVTLGERTNISATVFMRTTQRRHHDTVDVCSDQGLIYKDTYEGHYSTTDECFYPFSHVTSHPTRLNTKIATKTGSVVERSNEVHYRFSLSRLREMLLAHYATVAERNASAEDDGLVSCGVYPDVYENRTC